jgi:uncharacterized OsmC-like protein
MQEVRIMSRMQIREAIERLGSAIAAEPAKAQVKNPPVTARLTEGLKCELAGPQGQRFVTDMPQAMGGTATAPNPGWFLRGAMAACTASVIAMRAAKLGIALETLEVTVEGETDQRGILGLDENVSAGQSALRTIVKIRGHAAEETLRELVCWAEAHSPVGCTVREGPANPLEIQVV